MRVSDKPHSYGIKLRKDQCWLTLIIQTRLWELFWDVDGPELPKQSKNGEQSSSFREAWRSFPPVMGKRLCQNSELSFCLWSQQKLKPRTSCAGSEPGSDSTLARGRTAPSLLLRLHHHVVCWETQGSGCSGLHLQGECLCSTTPVLDSWIAAKLLEVKGQTRDSLVMY